MFKHLFRPEPESGKSKKRIIATSLTTTVWIAINFFSLPIQAQSDYEGLGRRGTRIWGDRACNITGLASQEEITAFLDHCAPKYTPEEQAYLDMKTQAAIGLLSFFFFDTGAFQRPSPAVVRRVTDYVDEGVSTVGTYRGSNGTRTITVQRRSSQIVIKDIKTGEIRVVNSRTGQLVDDVDSTIANGNTREGGSQARRNNRGNTTTEDPCLSYAPTSTSKNIIVELYSWLSIQSAEAACNPINYETSVKYGSLDKPNDSIQIKIIEADGKPSDSFINARRTDENKVFISDIVVPNALRLQDRGSSLVKALEDKVPDGTILWFTENLNKPFWKKMRFEPVSRNGVTEYQKIVSH